MSALPPIKRITKEDLKDAPSWITRLLYPLNQFLDSVYGALNRNLTFEENIRAQITTFTIVAGAAASNNTTSFALTLKRIPIGLFVVNKRKVSGNYAAIGAAVEVEWNYDGTAVQITSITGLTNGSTYSFTVILI